MRLVGKSKYSFNPFQVFGKENDTFNTQVRSMSLSTENRRKCTYDASNFQNFLGRACPQNPYRDGAPMLVTGRPLTESWLKACVYLQFLLRRGVGNSIASFKGQQYLFKLIFKKKQIPVIHVVVTTVSKDICPLLKASYKTPPYTIQNTHCLHNLENPYLHLCLNLLQLLLHSVMLRNISENTWFNYICSQFKSYRACSDKGVIFLAKAAPKQTNWFFWLLVGFECSVFFT